MISVAERARGFKNSIVEFEHTVSYGVGPVAVRLHLQKENFRINVKEVDESCDKIIKALELPLCLLYYDKRLDEHQVLPVYYKTIHEHQVPPVRGGCKVNHSSMSF